MKKHYDSMNFITLLWISMEKHSNIHSVKKRAIKKGCPMDSLVRTAENGAYPPTQNA